MGKTLGLGYREDLGSGISGSGACWGGQQARVENFPQENVPGHLVRGLGVRQVAEQEQPAGPATQAS